MNIFTTFYDQIACEPMISLIQQTIYMFVFLQINQIHKRKFHILTSKNFNKMKKIRCKRYPAIVGNTISMYAIITYIYS